MKNLLFAFHEKLGTYSTKEIRMIENSKRSFGLVSLRDEHGAFKKVSSSHISSKTEKIEIFVEVKL